MSARVTDEMVRRWLVWARNFEEIVAYHIGSGKARRFRVRLAPGVTYDGLPFRLREGLFDLFGHEVQDVVPAELMFTAREALAFGMGCAVGRTAALTHSDREWIAERMKEWTPELKAEFARLRDQARAEDDADREREAAEREAARQARMAAYRRRREAEQIEAN